MASLMKRRRRASRTSWASPTLTAPWPRTRTQINQSVWKGARPTQAATIHAPYRGHRDQQLRHQLVHPRIRLWSDQKARQTCGVTVLPQGQVPALQAAHTLPSWKPEAHRKQLRKYWMSRAKTEPLNSTRNRREWYNPAQGRRLRHPDRAHRW